jgi:hypothetical protein
MENKDFLKVAVDTINDRLQQYTSAEASEALRAALVEANGGSTKINPKTFRPGNAVFELVQELIPVIIDSGFKSDNPIFDIIEYRNIAEGDVNEFITEGSADFVVADVAKGIAAVRRQRITGGESITIPTSMKFVRVYENLGRLLAGRIDFNTFIDGVANAFNKQILADAYAAIDAISSSTAGLSQNYVLTGSFDEDETLELIDRVEAATGSSAKIIGTRSALRKMNADIISDEAKSDMYNIGYYGKWNGVPMICIKQNISKDGAFLLSNDKVLIIASDDKPIKVVNVGDGYMDDSAVNADMTKEYQYGQEFGVGTICAAALGVVNVASK